MIAAEIIALLVLALSPATSQATLLQGESSGTEADAADVAAAPAGAAPAAARSDVRLVLRQTADEGKSAVPPGMVEIPRGQVVVGTPVESIKTTGKTDDDVLGELLAETPRHTETVKDFYIDLTEVTNLQWKVYLDATGRKPSATLIEFGWPNGEFPAGQEQFPITNVNVSEIKDYVAWCGKRLPNEVEWTRAARGDTEFVYPWGDKWDPKACRSAASGSGQASSVAVGSFPSGVSPFGVFDMAGNVFEWVDSPFKEYPGFTPLVLEQGKKKSVTITPKFNSSWRVIKGGSFTTVSQFTRIDVRLGQSIMESDAALGFRCARATTPGLDAVRNGLQRLLSTDLFKGGLDETDIVAREIDSYDDTRKVITGYRFLAFGHRAPIKGPSLTKIRQTARDEFEPLGVLVSSENLRMADMDDKASIDKAEGLPNATPEQKAARLAALQRVQRVLPAGEYTLLFKAEGESKAYKEKQKHKAADKANGKDKDKPADEAADDKNAKDKKAKAGDPKNSKTGKDSKDEPAAEGEAGPEAMMPWPGLSSIADLEEDIDYPQDVDLILLLNANKVVVGYTKPLSITEVEVAPAVSTRSEDGKSWTIDFSLNQQTSKKGPRFKFGLELAGSGL